MADRTARPSTDAEHASLLYQRSEDEDEQSQGTWNDRVHSYAHEPLTPLTKILLVLALVLLLTTSVFIGLFAGAQHRLKMEHDKPTEPPTTVTVTNTVTSTATFSGTQILTTTTVVPTTVFPPVPTSTSVPHEKPCLEPHCIILSASILSGLDVTQDPCENFYDFANGGWLKAHPLPGDKASYGNFERLAQQNQEVIRTILETDTSPADSYDKALLKKLREFYTSCHNENELDQVGTAPLKQFVKTVRNLYQGKSVEISEDDAGDKAKGLTAAIAFLHSRGIEALFSFNIEGDVGNDPNQMSLWFSQPGFGLPSKEYFEEKSIRQMYTTTLEKLLLAVTDKDKNDVDAPEQEMTDVPADAQAKFWPPVPWPPWGGDDDDHDGGGKPDDGAKKARELAEKVVAFERKLAQASLDLDILYQDPIATYNPEPLSNLTKAIPQIHFPTYFSTFNIRTFPESVIVTYLDYPPALSQILRETSSEVVEGYLVTRAALSLSPYLGMNTPAWQAQRALVETLTGIKKGAVGDRAEYCIGKTEEVLGFAAGRYFVNVTFGGDSKEKGTKVISDIVAAFKKSLGHIDWMDEESATAAAQKADAIRVKVGYPLSPDTRSPRSLAQYYAGLQIEKNDFFGNMLRSFANDVFKQWIQLGRPRNKESWEMVPSTVNAYFNPPSNEIVFPAGILQPPFFSQYWPNYLAYGAFGQVASHELTHAFDSAGRLYNQQGKLEQWWTNATSEGFQVKQDCIVDQYSAYTIDDGKGGKIHVNGNLTSGENIGDSGLIQAYRAWKAQYQTSLDAGTEYVLPGVTYTRDQLFFIAFGQIWARAMKPAAAVQRIRTDPHSPSRYRVDGTVSNIPEFASAFKCSKTAKLNPPDEDRCVFWG